MPATKTAKIIRCRKCNVVLTNSNFSFKIRADIGLICKSCWNKKGRDWAEKHPEKKKEYYHSYHMKNKEKEREKNYLRNYGISIKDYEELFNEQNGKCAICGTSEIVRKKDKNFHIDHDHKLNIVRGLLCDNCNKGLGHFKDSIELLLKAKEYLENYGK